MLLKVFALSNLNEARSGEVISSTMVLDLEFYSATGIGPRSHERDCSQLATYIVRELGVCAQRTAEVSRVVTSLLPNTETWTQDRIEVKIGLINFEEQCLRSKRVSSFLWCMT